jgi:hypothetical protein
MTQPFLSIPQAAALLKRPPDEIRAAIVMGSLRAEPTPGQEDYRIRAEDLERWATEQGLALPKPAAARCCFPRSSVVKWLAVGALGVALLVPGLLYLRCNSEHARARRDANYAALQSLIAEVPADLKTVGDTELAHLSDQLERGARAARKLSRSDERFRPLRTLYEEKLALVRDETARRSLPAQ